MLIDALAFAEVFCLCTAAFLLFHKSGNTAAESVSYSIIPVFMLLSFIRQISFITGYSIISFSMEVFFWTASSVVIFRFRIAFFGIFRTVKNFGSQHLVSFVFLGLCLAYIAVHAFLPIPEELKNELYDIPAYEETGFFPLGQTSGLSTFLPVNHFVLFNTFLGVGTGPNARVFCFLAYLSIGSSTYALARRYSWPATAFTTTILVLSMPRLAVQAICPDTEIISIATALFCILAMYRCVELPAILDLVLLILGIFFVISENISSLIFAPILFALSCLVLFRRHGIAAWSSILAKNQYAFFAVVPAAIFSQAWLFLSRHFHAGAWTGAFSSLSFNTGGIQGALANFIRYVFESIYFTAPLDLFVEKLFNWSMAASLQSMYDFWVRPFLGESGAAQAFYLTWMPDELFSFGPVGFFLVIPALVYALWKGPRRLKACAMAFFVYFYLVCLIIAWAPGNAKFLSIFYVCSGFSISFFFPPWRVTKKTNNLLQTIGCVMLFLTLLAAS